MSADLADEPAGRAAAIARSWIANAAAWTEAVRGGRIESRRAATDAAVVEAVLERAPGRVLDIGCGEGWLGRALARRTVEVVGFDASEALVEAARAADPRGGVYETFDYGDFTAAPRRFGAFDAVVCNFALLDEPVAALLGACRAALAPGGAVVLQTVHPWAACGDAPYLDGWREERFDAFGGTFATPMPWYFRTLGSWLHALRDAALDVVAVREPCDPGTGRPLSLLVVAVGGPERGA